MSNLEGKRVKFTEDVSKRLQFEEIDLLSMEGKVLEFNEDIVRFLPDSDKKRRKVSKNTLGDESLIWTSRNADSRGYSNADSRGYSSVTKMVSEWTEELD